MNPRRGHNAQLRCADSIRTILDRLSADEAKSDGGISLAAYESCPSQLCRSFLGGPLHHRYHLGVTGKRQIDDEDISLVEGLTRMSLPGVSALEEEAHAACRTLFGAVESDLRPLSGMHAMLCVIGSLTDAGDVVWSVNPRHGGHASTASLIERLGRRHECVPWHDRGPDLAGVANRCLRLFPAMILIDIGATLAPLPMRELRSVVGPGTKIAYDASHVMGLIAGGAFPNPLSEGADVLFGNTHKSFPGPQKGMIHYKDPILANSSRARIGGAFVSSQHTGDTVALYLTLLEMLQFGREYASAMVSNSYRLVSALERGGVVILKHDGVATRSSTFWVVPPEGTSAHDLCRRLMQCGIYTNARSFENRELLRVGTQYVTRQGMTGHDMEAIASFWMRAILPTSSVGGLRQQVSTFVRQFGRVEYSFDSICVEAQNTM